MNQLNVSTTGGKRRVSGTWVREEKGIIVKGKGTEADSMKRCFRSLLGLFWLLGFVSSAEAIKIKVAEVQKGVAVIQGSEGAKNATITWEGSAVTQVNPNGGFSFNGVIPADCVGTLSDGVDTTAVVVLPCTPVGSAVPQTGLITSFDQNNPQRDDGALQKGVVLPSPRFTDNLDGTISDHLAKQCQLSGYS